MSVLQKSRQILQLKGIIVFILMFVVYWIGGSEGLAQDHGNLTDDEDYNLQLDRAIRWQEEADSLYHVSIFLRKQAARMDDPLEKGRLQVIITGLEDSLKVYRERADSFFEGLFQAGNPYIILDTTLHGINVYHYKLDEEFLAKLDEFDKNQDTLAGETINESDTLINFRVYKKSVYNDNNPIEDDFVLPQGSFYRIQLAVFSKEISHDHFKGLFPITTEIIKDKDMTRYFAGKFTRLEEAENALREVRSAGYPDAFILGYYNGVKSTPEKVRTLEKD
jgi:hypothetical protein